MENIARNIIPCAVDIVGPDGFLNILTEMEEYAINASGNDTKSCFFKICIIYFQIYLIVNCWI